VNEFHVLYQIVNFAIDDMDLDTLYGLIKITFLSSTLHLFDSFFYFLSLYRSCIFLILSFTYWFLYSLYTPNSSANIVWIWYILSSILLWMRYHRSSDISRMFIVFVVLLLMLAFKIIFSISVIFILVSTAIFIMSCTCFYTSITASNSFNVLWYNIV